MSMDVNTLRSAVTVVTFILFLGIVVWTLSKRRSAEFEEAAYLPFGQDD
jgi:cytochrome c oxidase cbb3-type subunit 4